MAAAARWTGTRQVIGSAGNVQLPTTLFTDAVSPASGITVLSVTALGDNGGYTATVPAPLSSAFLIAPTVLGAPADLVFSVVARDEAGNIARALFTVPTNAAGEGGPARKHRIRLLIVQAPRNRAYPQ